MEWVLWVHRPLASQVVMAKRGCGGGRGGHNKQGDSKQLQHCKPPFSLLYLKIIFGLAQLTCVLTI